MNIKLPNRNFFINNILIGIIGVIVIISSGIFIGFLDFQKFQTKEIEKIKRNGMLVSNRFQNVISSFYLTVKMLDKWIENNPEIDPRFNSEFNGIVKTYTEHTGSKIQIRMVTPDGKLFYFPSKNNKPLADVKDREYYKAHMTGDIDGIYFAEPVKSRVTGKWGIPISYKLKSKSNVVFILFGAIEFPTLDEILGGIGNSNETAVLLSRNDGKILYRKPFDEKIVGEYKNVLLRESKEVALEKGIAIVRKKAAERRLINYSMVEGFPVITVISENYDIKIQHWIAGFILKVAIIIIIMVVFIVLNIKTIKLFKQLQEANETKNKFLAMIAHDIKTPIGNGVILMELTIEDKDGIEKEEIFERLITVKNSMKNMYELLDNLLNWAILQKHQLQFNPVKTDTAAIISESLEVLYPIAKMKKIKIDYENQESIGLVADKQMMVTVFRNFISNSIKFTKDGGEIKIQVRKNGDKIEISIKDNGIGMSKDKVDNLFKNSRQTVSFGTKNEKGMGLGLILCKEFVEIHKGKIVVNSQPGIGSEFSVILPYKL